MFHRNGNGDFSYDSDSCNERSAGLEQWRVMQWASGQLWRYRLYWLKPPPVAVQQEALPWDAHVGCNCKPGRGSLHLRHIYEQSKKVWPGSQAIAKAKAYTANAFSNDTLALSTARLYTFSQPGHSLFGLNNSNPFDPQDLAPPSGQGGGQGQIAGGIITFGGGVPLYKNGKIIGALGVSGDTACTDHEIAKRVRTLAGLDPPGGPSVDDIAIQLRRWCVSLHASVVYQHVSKWSIHRQ